MENLNKTFYERQILTAAELNLIISKINEIIENIPSSSTQNPGITETEVNNKIKAAKDELQLKINQILSQIENLDDGNTHERTDEEMMDLFKQAGKEVLVYYGVCDENGHPFFNTIIDENGVKPAAIIGAITDNNGKLNSSIGISADQIILNGNTTLTGTLTALNGRIDNIVVPDTATIKNAVIQDIQAGNVTITGTLNYNRLVGAVETVTGSQISDTAAYAKVSSSTVRLPQNPIIGQTVYVEGVQGNILPYSGTALLAGLQYVDTVEYNIGGGSDTETNYRYCWQLVEYNTSTKLYNSTYNNLSQAFVHSYIYTGTQWVETTPIPNKIVVLTEAEKQSLGL